MMRVKYNPSTGKVINLGSRVQALEGDCLCTEYRPPFTVIIDGVETCPNIPEYLKPFDASLVNGTWRVPFSHSVKHWPGVSCYWDYKSGIGPGNVRIRITHRSPPEVPDEILTIRAFIYTNTWWQVYGGAQYAEGDDCLYGCGSGDGAPPEVCDLGYLSFGGHASWIAGTYQEWTQSTTYYVDDIVAYLGTMYQCIQDHTSCTSETCPSVDKPGLGSSWGDYWEVLEC